MKDRTITVVWNGKSQTYNVVGEISGEEAGYKHSEALLLSFTEGEMLQFVDRLNEANIKKAKEGGKHDGIRSIKEPKAE